MTDTSMAPELQEEEAPAQDLSIDDAAMPGTYAGPTFAKVPLFETARQPGEEVPETGGFTPLKDQRFNPALYRERQKQRLAAVNEGLAREVYGLDRNKYERADRLARKYGLDTSQVEPNMQEFEIKDLAEKFGAATPKVGAWLGSSTINALLGYDDIRNLSQIERNIQEMSGLERVTQNVAEFFKGQPKGAGVLAGGAMVGAGVNAAGFNRSQLSIMQRIDAGEAVPDTDDPLGYRYMSAEERTAAKAELQEQAAVPLTDIGIVKAGRKMPEWLDLMPAREGFGNSIGRQLGEGTGTLLAGIAASALTGPVGSFLLFSLSGSGEAAMNAMDTPGVTEDKIIEAARLGYIPGMTDSLPIEMLLGRIPFPGGKFFKLPANMIGGAVRVSARLGGQALVEAFQEGGQKALQNLIAREVYKPDQEIMEGVPGEAALGGGVGVIAQTGKELITAFSGRRRGDAGTGGKPQIQTREFQAADKAANLMADTVKLVQEAGMAKTDPAKLQELIGQITGSDANVYLPAEELGRLFQEGKVNDKVLAEWGVLDQLQEVRATGGSLVIPAANFLTSSMDPGAIADITQSVRRSIGADSQREAKANQADLQARIEEFTTRMEDVARQTEGQPDGSFVYQDMYKKLTAAGKSAAEAKALAAAYGEHYTSRAKLIGNGATADGLYTRRSYQVLGPGMDHAIRAIVKDEMDVVIARLQSGRSVKTAAKPILDILKARGGVAPQSPLAQSLVAMGITAKSNPGLFKANGLQSIDNLVASEEPLLTDNGIDVDENGYADPDALLAAIREEVAGRPWQTQAEKDRIALLDDPVSELQKIMDEAEFDYRNASPAAIRQFLEDQMKDAPAEAAGQTEAEFDQQPFGGTEVATTPLGDATTVVVDGVERPAQNSNGQPIHWSIEGVRNFWRWFGDSKVVDGEGHPLVVYHGSPAPKIDQFRPELIGKTNDSGYYGAGFYFTASRALADDYVPDNSRGAVQETYLAIGNPFVWDLSTPELEADTLKRVRAVLPNANVTTTGIRPSNGNYQKASLKKASAEWTAALQAAGYDGVFVETKGIDPSAPHEIIAFTPTQIKSATGNSGAFDPNDARVLYQGKVPTFEQFEAAAARGQVHQAFDAEEDVENILAKKVPAIALDLMDDGGPLGDAYEEGTLTERFEEAGLFVDDNNMGRVFVGTTQENLDRIKNAGNPVEYGRAFGYSEDDIAAFYLKLRGGDAAIAYENYAEDYADATGEVMVLYQGGSPVPAAVSAVVDLAATRRLAASQQWPTNRDFKIALQNAVRAAAGRHDLSEDTPENRAYLEEQVLREARAALITNSNAVGWYDEKVTIALEVLAAIHPELKTDEQAKFAFIWALAVTSNGVKVVKNFELAERAYGIWKASNKNPAKRRMPTKGIGVGTSAGKIDGGLKEYNRLIEKLGFAALRDFATTMRANRDIKPIAGRNVSGEGMDTQVYGAGILGPKIGNGFFMNLFGEFGQLTMDRWWVRMWGRLTGELVDTDKAKIRKARDTFVALVDYIKANEKATKAVEAAIGRRLSSRRPADMAAAIVRASSKKEVREALIAVLPNKPGVYKAVLGIRGRLNDFKSAGDELRKVASAYDKRLDGQIEQPRGSKQRDMMREVSAKVLAELQKEHPHLTMADFQALLWYPEKTLYDAAGTTEEEGQDGYVDEEAPDYANAAIALAKAQGIPQRSINAAVKRAQVAIAARKRAGRRGRGYAQPSGNDRSGVGQLAGSAPLYQTGGTAPSPIAPPFYSAVERAAQSLKQEKGSGEQMLAMLQKTPGVKAEEIAWLGIDTFLAGKKSVTKAELLEHIRTNKVEVKEVTLSDDNAPNNKDIESNDDVRRLEEDVAAKMVEEFSIKQGDDGKWYVADHPQSYEAFDTFEDANDFLHEDALDRAQAMSVEEAIQFLGSGDVTPGGRTQFNRAELLIPGGENYRELLLTLPVQDGRTPEQKEFADLDRRMREDGLFSEDERRWEGLGRALGENGREVARGGPNAGAFRGGHFNEPNVLAHIRFNERTDAAGKRVLFIEEIQSDWHQKGRRYGYKPPANFKAALPPGMTLREGQGETGRAFWEVLDGDGKRVSWAREKETALTDAWMSVNTDNDAQPDAPLKKTWHETALRRMVRYAAENGFDSVAWTTGEQQAERYDLSKHIDSLKWYRDDDGYRISAKRYDNIVFQKSGLTASALADNIGKDLAEKIDANQEEYGVLSGLDLKVGGGGMKGFYDRILPTYANKFGKPFGVKVAAVRLEGTETQAIPKLSADELKAEVHSLPITDKMRETVLAEGVPLFQPGGADVRRGSFERQRDPVGNITNIIRLTQNANRSTFLHETGHLWFFEMVDDAFDPEVRVEARERLLADLQKLTDWFGLKIDVKASSPQELHSLVTRDMHEKWARGFEKYLMEGRAPSKAMEPIMAKFSAWLVRLYKVLTNPYFDVDLTDEVRGVMDRLLATEEAIEEARASRMYAIPAELAEAMTTAERVAAENLAEAAATEARITMQSRVANEIARERGKEWATEKAKVTEAVTLEVRRQPAYAALNLLRKSEAPDGSIIINEDQTPRSFKLDRRDMIARYGEEIIGLLPRGIWAKRGEQSIDADVMAEIVGFDSADAMKLALMGIKDVSEAALIKAQVDIELKQRHAEIDGEIGEAAAAAVANDRQLELMALQARILQRLAGSTLAKVAERQAVQQGAMPLSEAREAADEAAADTDTMERTGAPAEAMLPAQMGEAYARGVPAAQATLRAAEAKAKATVAKLPPVSYDVEIIKEAAKAFVRRRLVKDLGTPEKYEAEAARLTKRIERAIAGREYDEAQTLMEQRLFNLQMAKEVRKAQTEVEKARTFLDGFNATKTRLRIGKADNNRDNSTITDDDWVTLVNKHAPEDAAGKTRDQILLMRLENDGDTENYIASLEYGYLSQIDTLLEGYEFRRVTNAWVDRKAKLAAWLNGQAATGGVVPEVPKAVMDRLEVKSYREVPFGELMDLRDAVRSIAHVAGEQNKFMREAEKREYAAVIEEAIDTIEANVDELPAEVNPQRPGFWADNAETASSLMALVTKAQTWFAKMDGKEGGFFFKLILAPIRRAEIARLQRLVKEGEAFDAIVKKHYGTMTPNWEAASTKKHIAAINKSLTLEERLAVALNWGNEGNRKALLNDKGRARAGWGEAQYQAIIDTLDKRDLDFAQDVRDFIDGFWLEIAALQKRRTGLAPEKVEATPMVTRHGTYRGGYYPLKYDPKSQVRTKELTTDELFAAQTSGANSAASTKRGHTEARTSSGGQTPMLTLDVISHHIIQVVTDLEMGPAIADAWKILNNKKLKDTIAARMGLEVVEHLDIWIKDTAVGQIQAGDKASQILRGLRSSVAVGAMGLKLGTSLMQVSGFTHTAVQVGKRNMLMGLLKFSRNPVGAYKQVTGLSPFMAERTKTFQRDVADAIDMARGQSAFRRNSISAYFFLIGKMQMFVDIPTWLGGYRKALKQGLTGDAAVDFADNEVIGAQGSGLFSELSPVERGTLGRDSRLKETTKIWTTFYSYFNTKLNLAMRRTQETDFRKPWEVAELIADYALIFWVEAVISQMIRDLPNLILDDEDDDEDKTFWQIFGAQTKLAAENVLGTLPLAREIVNAAKGFDAGPSGTSALADVGKGGVALGKLVYALLDEDTDADWWPAMRSLVLMGNVLSPVKYPSGQINTMLTALEKELEGQDVGWIEYLMKKPKEK